MLEKNVYVHMTTTKLVSSDYFYAPFLFTFDESVTADALPG